MPTSLYLAKARRAGRRSRHGRWRRERLTLTTGIRACGHTPLERPGAHNEHACLERTYREVDLALFGRCLLWERKVMEVRR